MRRVATSGNRDDNGASMTRRMRPLELDRARRDDVFDPVIEGERYRLSPAWSLEIWKRVVVDVTDIEGRCDTEQARTQFCGLPWSSSCAADGGDPMSALLTRVGVEPDLVTKEARRGWMDVAPEWNTSLHGGPDAGRSR